MTHTEILDTFVTLHDARRVKLRVLRSFFDSTCQMETCQKLIIIISCFRVCA